MSRHLAKLWNKFYFWEDFKAQTVIVPYYALQKPEIKAW